MSKCKCYTCGKEIPNTEMRRVLGYSFCSNKCIEEFYEYYRQAMEFFANIGGRTTM